MNRTRDTVAEVARRTIVLAAISVALVGCKDVVRDLAHCKLKAMEIYKSLPAEGDERAGQYVLNCMQAAGYRLVGKCASGTAGYTYRSCYE
jgi:hypothetical protein